MALFGTPLALNFRDLGDCKSKRVALPKGIFFRCAKLSLLSKEECARLLQRYNIKCVIDLRTPVEADEFPDPLPEDVKYLQFPLFGASTIGISHETGSDPMTIIKNLRNHPEKLKAMIPDFKELYTKLVTEESSREQLDKVLTVLKDNEAQGKATLFHCTAGKDRTGIVSMALLMDKGVEEDVIIKDYMKTNQSAFFPTMKKCFGIWLLTQNWEMVKTIYSCFMTNKSRILVAMKHYKSNKQ